MRKSASYVIVSSAHGETFKLEHVDAENRDAWSRVEFDVKLDRVSGYYKCQCRLYEHFGIICCHVMLVMIQTGVKLIPECHILKRWTNSARDGFNGQTNLTGIDNSSEAARTLRHKRLYMTVLDLVSAGEYDDSTCDLVMKYVEIGKKKIAEYKATISTTCQIGYNSGGPMSLSADAQLSKNERPVQSGSCGMQIFDSKQKFGIEVSSIKAPIIKQKIGKPTNKRYLSHFDSHITRTKGELVQKPKNGPPGGRTGVHQSRFCSGCKSPTHDIRICPKRIESSKTTAKKKRKTTKIDFKF